MFNKQAPEFPGNSENKQNNDDECIVLSLMNRPLSLLFCWVFEIFILCMLVVLGWLPSKTVELNLSNCELNSISAIGGQCPSLKVLNISHNFITVWLFVLLTGFPVTVTNFI